MSGTTHVARHQWATVRDPDTIVVCVVDGCPAIRRRWPTSGVYMYARIAGATWVRRAPPCVAATCRQATKGADAQVASLGIV